jgi:hypothetical protein
MIVLIPTDARQGLIEHVVRYMLADFLNLIVRVIFLVLAFV